MRSPATETVIDGVLLGAGLVFIVGDAAETSWGALAKVVATVVVFWGARVYADSVAHLGDAPEADLPLGQRIANAVRAAAGHDWGMLLGAALPLSVLLLGRGRLLDDGRAVWAVLWLAVVVLGVLGYLKVASWTSSRWARLAGGAATAALGLALVLLKTVLH